MYLNLKTEMERIGVTREQIAILLDIHRNSVANKLDGRSSFTIEEALRLREKYFPYADFQYLFKKVKAAG